MWMSAVELASLALTFPATPCSAAVTQAKVFFQGIPAEKG